ncbi:clamp-binding protein CrfC, partial [Escherichia coli]|nr:clamp-binding protein CrfC [Escherichia coli]
DMTMQRQRQIVVSDEVQHEVEEALNATDAFLLRQKDELHQALGDIFSRPPILDLPGREPSSLREDDADAIQQLVLDDEGQAQIVLS